LYLFLAPAEKDSSVSSVSSFFGGTDITDAAGHVVLNSLLIFLWLWTSVHYSSRYQKSIIIVGIIWAVVTEFLQTYIPGRGGSLLDMIANSIGIIAGIWLYSVLRNHLSETDSST
jgi:VanZ family protein